MLTCVCDCGELVREAIRSPRPKRHASLNPFPLDSGSRRTSPHRASPYPQAAAGRVVHTWARQTEAVPLKRFFFVSTYSDGGQELIKAQANSYPGSALPVDGLVTATVRLSYEHTEEPTTFRAVSSEVNGHL